MPSLRLRVALHDRQVGLLVEGVVAPLLGALLQREGGPRVSVAAYPTDHPS